MAQGAGGTTTRQIIVAADDTALQNLIGVARSADAALSAIGQGPAAAGFKSVAGNVAVAAAALVDLGKQAFDAAASLVNLASEGAKLQQLEMSFKALGGGGKELEKLKDLTGGLVSDADLMKASNLASLFNLPKEEIPKLIKLAQGASVALGSTVGKALEDTFTAASRQSKMIADNMGIVIGDLGKAQAEYAKKIGVSVDSLTDKQKQLVFVQRMIAEGGRQVDLAALSQSNQFAKGEVALENFVNKMKIMAAEAFVSSGAMDAMMGVFSQVESLFLGNADAIGGALMPAFKALVGIVPPLLQVVGALLPLFEQAAPLLTMVGSIVTALAPLVGGLAVVFGKVLGVVVDFVEIGLWGLISTLEIVVGVFSDDLAAGFTKAREQIETLTLAANEDSEAFYAMDSAARAMVAANSDAEGSAGDLTTALRSLATQAEATALSVARAFNPSAFPVEAAVGNVQKLEEAFKKIKPEELIKRLDKLGESKNFIKTQEDAIKALSQQIAIDFASVNGIVGAETQALYKHSEELIRASLGNAAKEGINIQLDAFRTVGDLQKMEEDRLAFGVSTLGELAMQGVKTRVDALKKLEDEYARIEAAIGASGVLNEAAKGVEIERLANEYNAAADAIDKEFEKRAAEKAKGRGGGGGRDDTLRFIFQAELALMDDLERKKLESQKKYQELADKLPKDQVDLKAALAQQAVAEVARIESEALAKRQEDEAKLTQFLATESERRYMQAIDAANREAEEMRRIAGPMNRGALVGIEEQRQKAIGAAAMQSLAEGPLAGLANIGTAVADNMAGGFEVVTGMMDSFDERAAQSAETWASAFQNMGTSIVDTFMQIGVAGANTREQTFKLMGGLFGQLSTAFLAWATAEGNLLAGNPFGAAAAAIALGVVASAISAFGSRGKGGGGGGAQGSSGARQLMDRRRDEGERMAAVTVYNYGFATPDEIARASSRATKRGGDLRGRERGAP